MVHIILRVTIVIFPVVRARGHQPRSGSGGPRSPSLPAAGFPAAPPPPPACPASAEHLGGTWVAPGLHLAGQSRRLPGAGGPRGGRAGERPRQSAPARGPGVFGAASGAASAGEAWRMAGCGYPACAPRASPSPSPSFPGCGQLPAAAGLDGYQRAQLVALLSQVSPRPRGAGSRDAAVQVNPRRDASVQCSLGRSRLPRGARDPGVPAGPGLGGAGGASSSPQPEQGRPPRPPRPPRTAAVYSSVASRPLPTCPHPPDGAEDQEDEDEEEEEGDSARKAPPRPGEEAGGGQAAPDAEGPRSSPRSPEPATERPRFQGRAGPRARFSPGAGTKRPIEVADGPLPACEMKGTQGSQELNPGDSSGFVQFLEQKYGYYHCKDCNIRWESAYVWCVQGTNKVYFKQFCRTCQKSYNPYRVEDITCQSCKQTRCSCTVKLRHVDPKRPHRQDLCGRCKGKRLSCDSTFSFKYII
ncbi:zygote arrest protein 1 isoform X4 [Canis lupus familiaris]|uniref:zygote arrest protein 1 n=1 Tax=Canis lupus dingo TaxID=286419 RepID=UPI0018F29227|nr:zygote arrest protein 1 isoform X4 [Canis lupus familiaris]XP_048949032.1 zygote arrest protein 1 [Canis lupus dingo]